MTVEPSDEVDFFVSYTAVDREWAVWITDVLERHGYSVICQAKDFQPSDDWKHGMVVALRRARTVLAVVSEPYTKAVYSGVEWEQAALDDPGGTKGRLLPVWVTDWQPIGILGSRVAVPLFGLDGVAAEAALLRGAAAAARRGGRTAPGPVPGEADPAAPARFPGERVSVWNIDKPRTKIFPGRAKELAQLRACRAEDGRPGICAVQGLGGIGKSQLVIEYAHRHASEFDVVWWISAEEPVTISDGFRMLGAAIGIETFHSAEQLRDRVYEVLATTRGWLLIFDNADSIADIRRWIPRKDEAGSRGQILITTIRGGFTDIGAVVTPAPLDLAAATAILHSRVPSMTADEAAAIVAKIGRLPLELKSTAAYIDRTRLNAAEFRDLVEREPEVLLYGAPSSTGEPGIPATWTLSFARLRADAPAATQLLELIAFLGADAIPLYLLTGSPERLPEPLASAVRTELGVNDVVAAIADYSLVERVDGKLFVHRSVQAAVRRRLTAQLDWSGAVPAPLVTAVGCLRAAVPTEIRGAPRSWQRWAELLPHVLEVVRRAPAGTVQLADDVGMLLDHGACYLRERGVLRQAQELAENAVAIVTAAHGDLHPAVGAYRGNLAMILVDAERPTEALPHAEQALAIAERTDGSHPLEAARRRSTLALIQRDRNDATAARRGAQRALTDTRKILGAGHPEVALRLNDLASILAAMAARSRNPTALREAEKHARAAVDIAEKALPAGSPELARHLSLLSRILRSLGELPAALSAAERGIAIEQAAYGPNHSILPTRLHNIAAILRRQKKAEAALSFAARALAIDEATYGLRSPVLVSRLHQLAVISCDLGAWDDARGYAERGLRIAERPDGEPSPYARSLSKVLNRIPADR
ncbi:tetratricopeptide repeat protein [Nocardia sp. NPDC057353]|uniref:tetratricopeptide repeat protein n=1 Tax=Nocardia sp. NPDC057353 TaxID=3346104 RepID=UPI003632D561